MPNNNSNQNMKPNYLYEIVDKVGEDTFKYGISSDPIGEDGMSDRMRKQVNYLNRLYEWVRFFGRILFYDIPGKKEARKIEKEHIKEYERIHGRKPKGNQVHFKLSLRYIHPMTPSHRMNIAQRQFEMHPGNPRY